MAGGRINKPKISEQNQDKVFCPGFSFVYVAFGFCLVNCLSNADYFLSVPVKIELFPDRLVFSNPGTIRLGKKQMLHGGITSPRNKAILNMFNYIGVGERAGSGVPNIYDIWEKESYQEPMVEELSGREGTICTVVTLPLVEKEPVSHLSDEGAKKGAKKSAKSEEIKQRIEAVYQEICKNTSVKNVELESLVGATKRQVESALKALQNEGRIHREDGNRKGKWIID